MPERAMAETDGINREVPNVFGGEEINYIRLVCERLPVGPEDGPGKIH